MPMVPSLPAAILEAAAHMSGAVGDTVAVEVAGGGRSERSFLGKFVDEDSNDFGFESFDRAAPLGACLDNFDGGFAATFGVENVLRVFERFFGDAFLGAALGTFVDNCVGEIVGDFAGVGACDGGIDFRVGRFAGTVVGRFGGFVDGRFGCRTGDLVGRGFAVVGTPT